MIKYVCFACLVILFYSQSLHHQVGGVEIMRWMTRQMDNLFQSYPPIENMLFWIFWVC